VYLLRPERIVEASLSGQADGGSRKDSLSEADRRWPIWSGVISGVLGSVGNDLPTFARLSGSFHAGIGDFFQTGLGWPVLEAASVGSEGAVSEPDRNPGLVDGDQALVVLVWLV